MPQHPRRRDPDAHRPRDVTVLVAEDDPDSREILRQMTAWFGASVHAVDNGRDALKFLARRTPDLILLDLRLPGVDGYAVMKHVRTNPRLHRVQTVAVTALCSPADYRRTWEAGFDVHLAKPIDIDTLAAIVERVVGGRPPTDRRPS